MKNALMVFLCSCAFGMVAGPVLANEAPLFLEGGVSPEMGGVASDDFGFYSLWNDPDGDFVVDVKVRYRKAGSQNSWTVVVLSYVPGSDPIMMEKAFFIDAPTGTYEFEFQASDAVSEEGPRLHTTDWHSSGQFSIQRFRTRLRECIGEDLEQFPGSFVSLAPSILAPGHFEEAASALLLGGVNAAPGRENFVWCVSKGTLESDPEYPNYQRVKYHPPRVSANESVDVVLAVSNGEGFVERVEKTITIMDRLSNDTLNPPPVIELLSLGLFTVGESSVVKMLVENVDTELQLEPYHGRLEFSCDNDNWQYINDIHDQQELVYWTPEKAGNNCRLRAQVTDGHSAPSVVTSEIFSIVGSFALQAVILRDDLPVESTGVVLHISDATILQRLTELPYGAATFYGLEAGVYTVSCGASYICLPEMHQVTLSEEHPYTIVEFELIGTEPPGVPVALDIKPGSDVNPINPNSNGKIPVAILSSSTHDVTTEIDRESLTFGRTGDEESLHHRGNGQPNCGEGDVNGDGLVDLVCHFFTRIANFQAGDTKGFLKGQLTDDTTFEAMDTITIVGNGHDSDNDGVDDDTESAAPNNGDGNGDGKFDDQQLNVTSLLANGSNEYLTFVVSPGCVANNVAALSPATLGVPDNDYSYPQGILGFSLTEASSGSCSSTDVTVLYHGTATLPDAVYRKFGARPGVNTAEWYNLPASSGTAIIDGLTVATMTYQLTDGGLGDDDLAANGIIRDPGGPAIPNGTITPDPTAIPTLSPFGMLILVGLILLIAGTLLRRKQQVN